MQDRGSGPHPASLLPQVVTRCLLSTAGSKYVVSSLRTRNNGCMNPMQVTIRSPEDILALVPVTFGFHPRESAVILAFGSPVFQARIDLVEHDLEAMTTELLHPLWRYPAAEIACVLFTASESLARAAAAELNRQMTVRQIRELCCLQARENAWLDLRNKSAQSQPWQVQDHRFLRQGVAAGVQIWSRREDLAQSLEQDPTGQYQVELWLKQNCEGTQASSKDALERFIQARRLGLALSSAEAGGLLRDLKCVTARDAVLMAHSRKWAERQVQLWQGLWKVSPRGYQAESATMLGFAAWLSGNGALAWCALDRADDAEPGHQFAALVTQLLVRAVGPHEWPCPTG